MKVIFLYAVQERKYFRGVFDDDVSITALMMTSS